MCSLMLLNHQREFHLIMRDFLLIAFILCGLFLCGICGNDKEKDEEVDKIVSEQIVPNNRVYPFMVYFTQSSWFTRKTSFICTGTLIKPNKVLTSASCFDGIQSGTVFTPTPWTPMAWLGTNVLDGPTRISRAVIAVNKYPQYNQLNNGNRDNIAVVTLQSEVPSSISPVRLGIRLMPKVGVPSELIAVGWGYTEGVSGYLRHSYMNLVQSSVCQTVFGNVDNSNTICVRYDNIGACALDVGSPILSNDGKQIIGVIGKNMRCGGGEPIVAVDIRKYGSSWIFNQ